MTVTIFDRFNGDILLVLILCPDEYPLDCAAKLAAIPASERLAGGTCPVATVVISGGGYR